MTTSAFLTFGSAEGTPSLEYSAGGVFHEDTPSNLTTLSPQVRNDMADDTARQVIMIMSNYAVPCLYFILFILGFIGNSVVVYVSCFLTKKSKNAVDIFVGNLAFADLALIATLPFWGVTHIFGGVWAFEDAGCKIFSFLTNLNMYSSIFLITAMAVDRYIVVVKAVKVRAKSLRTVQRTSVSCAVIWVFALIFALPSAILREKTMFGTKTVCSWVYPKNTSELWWGLHIVSRNVFGFFIPLAVICRCYCVIISYVRGRSNAIHTSSSRSQNGGNKQQQHVTRLVTTLILAFVICWMPNQLSNFCHSLVHFRALPRPSKRGEGIVYLIHLLTTVLSFCNSVINPVIYSTSPSHRMHIKILFWRIFKRHDVGRTGSYTTYVTANKDPFGCLLKPAPHTKLQDPEGNGNQRAMSEVTRLSPKSEERRISNNCSTTVTVAHSPSAVSCRLWRTGSDENAECIRGKPIPSKEETAAYNRPTGVEPPAIVINECSSMGNPDRTLPPGGYQFMEDDLSQGTMYVDCTDCDDPVCAVSTENQIVTSQC